MLSRLLNVRHPTAKQAVITAIDLLGLWVHFAVVRCLVNHEDIHLTSLTSISKCSCLEDQIW